VSTCQSWNMPQIQQHNKMSKTKPFECCHVKLSIKKNYQKVMLMVQNARLHFIFCQQHFIFVYSLHVIMVLGETLASPATLDCMSWCQAICKFLLCHSALVRFVYLASNSRIQTSSFCTACKKSIFML